MGFSASADCSFRSEEVIQFKNSFYNYVIKSEQTHAMVQFECDEKNEQGMKH